jgi:hypothetical protein
MNHQNRREQYRMPLEGGQFSVHHHVKTALFVLKSLPLAVLLHWAQLLDQFLLLDF